MLKKIFVLSVAMLILTVLNVSASEEETITITIPKALKGLSIGTLAYIDYSNGKTGAPGGDQDVYNEFRLTRGYLTIKKKIQPWLSARTTIDIHKEDNGDYNERLKYLYAELRPADLGFLTSMKAEIGLGHIPWLDFEEHINPYRCQGTMAIERAGVFNSADTGISIRGDFGGKLGHAEEKTGNHHYDGRYGTWHVGVYNGPGYHGTEENNNKVIEGRITLRPFPDIIPGLQFSYFGLDGEGNEKSAASGDYPDYRVNIGMLSFQHPALVATAQYIKTKGNMKGTWVDAAGDPLDTEGYSLFADIRLPVFGERVSIFGRYDNVDIDKDDAIANDTDYTMIIAGVSYEIYKGNMLLCSYETTDYGQDSGGKGNLPVPGNDLGDDEKFQVVWQIKY